MEKYKKVRVILDGLRCAGCREKLEAKKDAFYSLNREGKTTGLAYCEKCAKK